MARSGGKAALSAVCAALVMTPAYSMDFNGAWATEPGVCEKIFEKKGAHLAFRPDSDTYGSGFIIDGNRIRGQTATCNIKSRKDSGDEVHMIAACSMEVMFSDVQLSMKVDNNDSITRFFPGMPDISIRYYRCSI